VACIVSRMAPRTGRPPIDNPRTEIIRIRLTPDERDRLQGLADAAGQPLALWMHDDLLRKRRRR
jgi:hypothetical protein